MNQDVIQGNWKQLTGRIQTQWGKLTDDDLDVMEGHHEYLVGKLQERYGWEKDQAEKEVRRFEKEL